MFKLSGPHVVYQNIDGEVIIVDLRNGFYFSLTESGVTVWDAIIAGRSRLDIVELVAAQFDAARENIEPAVSQFIDRLVDEALITPDEPLAATGSESQATLSEPAGAAVLDFSPPANMSKRRRFTAPELLKFTDMEDILALDPIHDFDDAGWPHAVKT